MEVTSLGHIFERVRLVDEDVWSPMWRSGEGAEVVDISWCEPAPELALSRTRHLMAVPFEQALVLFRPELFFHPGMAAFDGEIFDECGLEEVLAPGDALAWTLARNTSFTQWGSTFVGAIFGSAAAWQHGVRHASQDASGSGIKPPGLSRSSPVVERFRLASRRDFPKAGQCAYALAPRHPETGELLDEWSWRKSTAYVLQPAPELEGATTVTAVRRMAKGAARALEAAGAGSATLVRRLFTAHVSRLERCFRDEAFAQLMAAEAYAVVTIRKCGRGPPLLPTGDVESLEWHKPEDKSVILPEYLRKLMRHFGFAHVAVFSSLDGRQLVPYQAAVRRGDWERAWQLLESPFAGQRKAYRRLHGGPHAPELTLRFDARFCAEFALADDLPESPDHLAVQVRGTFMHYALRKGSEEEPHAAADDSCMLRKKAMLC